MVRRNWALLVFLGGGVALSFRYNYWELEQGYYRRRFAIHYS